MDGKFILRIAIFIAFVTIIALFAACGHGSRRVPTISAIGAQQAAELPAMEQQVTWPEGLPEDQLQPWEELDANGFVVPPKGVSNLNFDSIFASGIERYLEAGDVTDFGEASSFASGAAGGEEISYAIYRLPMGADQPGTITADVNVHNGGAYYVGVGDYSVNTWHWYGPYSATHVRFSVPEAEYTSGIGNLMLAVVAYDGAAFDVVAIGANARDLADTDAPPAPDAPSLTPVTGGVFAEWIKVAAGDLAGYTIYADGEAVLDYIEGGTSVVVPATDEVEVTLTAVDISGNESEMSAPATETPLAGEMPVVELTATAASGVRNDAITLTATGAETYDWDIDGDGTWDFTDDPTGVSEADTNDLGVIRPAVRAHTAEGGFSLNAISLFITGNFRPVVMATVDMPCGWEPLSVNFTLVAEDDDGTIDEYAWDFNGDGTFDDSSPTNPTPLAHIYDDWGMYNPKFRVTDNDGAWAVDTVAVQVLGDISNLPPVADLQIGMGEESGDAPHTVSFDASLSDDPDDSIVRYWWDFDGDGIYEGTTTTATCSYTYSIPDYYDPAVMVEDSCGGTDTAAVAITARGWRHFTFGNSDPDDEISMVVVDGNPAIACEYDEWPMRGTYWRANDSLGISWSDSQNFADNNVYGDVSLAVVNGNPAVAYYGYDALDNSCAHFVRAVDAQGTTWGTPVLVDSDDQTGNDARLAVVDGNPAILYKYYGSPDELRYCRATDANGTAWGSPVALVAKDSCYSYPGALFVADGNPAVVYHDSPDGEVVYIRATDAQGTAWGAPQVIVSEDDPSDWIGDPSAAMVAGNPAVVYEYYDSDSSESIKEDIMYIRATDAAGSAWGTPVVVCDNTWDASDMGNMTVINGNPAFCFEWDDGDNVVYIRATDATGTAWGTPELVDPMNWSVYDDCCLAEVNGLAAIAYHYTNRPGDSNYASLKYAIKIE